MLFREIPGVNKKRRMGGLLIALSAGFILSLWMRHQTNFWEDHIVKGNRAFTQQDYTKAQDHYERALKKTAKLEQQDPRLAVTLNNLALIYLQQDRRADAITLYHQAIQILEQANNMTREIEQIRIQIKKIGGSTNADPPNSVQH